MKRVVLSAVAFLSLGVSAARADIPPPPPPPKPPTKPIPTTDTAPVVADIAATAALVLTGAWLLRSRRRIQPQS